MYVLNFFFFLPSSSGKHWLANSSWLAWGESGGRHTKHFSNQRLELLHGVHEVSQASRCTIVFTLEQAALSFSKENSPMFLAIRAVWSRQLSIFWNSLHCPRKGVLFGPDNGNIDFKIFEFWLCRANSERKLLAFRTPTTVLLHKLASFLAVLHSPRSIRLIQPTLLTPFISFSLTKRKKKKKIERILPTKLCHLPSVRSQSG